MSQRPRQTLSQRFFSMFRGTRNRGTRNKSLGNKESANKPNKNTVNRSVRIPNVEVSLNRNSRGKNLISITSRSVALNPKRKLTPKKRLTPRLSPARSSEDITSEIIEIKDHIDHLESMKSILEKRLIDIRAETPSNLKRIDQIMQLIESHTGEIKNLHEKKKELSKQFPRNNS
jgi:hypothetical protein